MHDADHDALPLSLDGADATINNRMLVVATLAALLLAGSAMVYRARPFLHSAVSNTATSEKEPGTSSQDRELDLKPQRKAAGLSVKGNSAGEGSVDVQIAENTGPTPPALSTKPVVDLETSKDSKSSRSKDRRRRGKDPLKEILKGGKKAKLLTSNLTAPSKGTSSTPTKTSQYNFNNDQGNDNEGDDDDDDDVAEYEQRASPTSSSASLLPDSAPHSLSRAKGKRAQRNTSVDLTGTTHFSSAGSTSTSHSRAASNSEVSQKQSQRLDSQHSDHLHSLQSDLPPSDHSHDYPPSSYLASLSASEENDGRPHSRMSSYSSTSLSHPHTNTYQPNLPMNEKDVDAGLGSHLRTHSSVPRLDENGQARTVDLASGNDGGVEAASHEGEGEGHSGKIVWLRDSSSSPSTVTTTTARLVDADGFSKPKSKSKSKSKASASSTSSSVSIDTTTTDITTTTTTGTTSMTSSLVMTRATSPSPSDASKKTPTLATTTAANDNDIPTPPLATGTKARNSRKTQSGSPKKGDNKRPNPWNWDGAGGMDSSSSFALDAAAANIIASVTSVERNSKEKEFKGKDLDTYKKPPRLQGPKGGATFSAVAASGTGMGLTTAASHPASLYSPINTSFAGVPGSVSFSAAPPLSSLSPAGGGEGEEEESSTREREEEEVFTFPTLNPTTTSGSSGPSRTRSSLTDINSNNNFNNNTPQINNTRRARPPTPSRSLSSASHTPPPPSSSSPSSQPGSISSSSGVNGGSVPNPNANGGGGVLLSTQTQLASLRGALEAARLREEKHKTEMERVVKEVDVLRWEHANSRRGEIELQTHVRQLMQQLQTYASLFASMAPQLNAQYQQYFLQQQQQLQQAQQQLANGSSAGGGTPGAAATTAESVNSDVDASATLEGNADSSSMMSTTTQESTSTHSSTSAQPQNQTPTQQPSNPPPPLHIPTTFPAFQTNAVNGMSSPPGVLSPSLGISSYPGSPPFFPYSMSPHLHAPPTPHTHPLLFAQQLQLMQQQQYQQQLNATQAQVQSQAQPSPHQANLFSMHFPPGPHPPSMMSPHQHHQVYATHGAGSAFGMGSGPSSVAGTSSAGSLSPDLGGSPSPSGAGVNGKRRSRTRTQTANGRMSARGVGAAVGVWEERTIGDPWVGGVGVEENVIEEEPEKESLDDVLLDGSLRRVNGRASVGEEEEGEEGFGEEGFNVLLADAILKRPGSIRVRSLSKKDKAGDFGGVESEKGNSPTKNKHDATVVVEQEEAEQLTEFTFPSLSNLGNVHYRSDSRKVGKDCAVVFGASSEAGGFPAIPSVVPNALASSELLEDDKASWVLPSFVEGSDQSSVEPESQDIPVESESSHDLEITLSKEGMVPNSTESISHSELPTTSPVSNVVTLSSE